MDRSEQIIRYLNGELSDTERAKFEQQLQNDMPLNEEVTILQEMEWYAQNQEELHKAQESINQVGDKYKMSKRRSKMRRLQLISIAAGVLLLGIVGYFYSISYQEQDLYKEYFDPPLASFDQRDGDNKTQTEIDIQRILKEATIAYNQNRADEAVAIFDKVGNPTDEAIFYHALAYMKAGDMKQAHQKLEYLYSESNIVKNDAAWYLALLHIKNGEIDKSKILLAELQSSPTYRTRSQELANRISD